jgi:hypothetical protein
MRLLQRAVRWAERSDTDHLKENREFSLRPHHVGAI